MREKEWKVRLWGKVLMISIWERQKDKCEFWGSGSVNSLPISALLSWRHFCLSLHKSLRLSVTHLTHDIPSASALGKSYVFQDKAYSELSKLSWSFQFSGGLKSSHVDSKSTIFEVSSWHSPPPPPPPSKNKTENRNRVRVNACALRLQKSPPPPPLLAIWKETEIRKTWQNGRKSLCFIAKFSALKWSEVCQNGNSWFESHLQFQRYCGDANSVSLSLFLSLSISLSIYLSLSLSLSFSLRLYLMEHTSSTINQLKICPKSKTTWHLLFGGLIGNESNLTFIKFGIVVGTWVAKWDGKRNEQVLVKKKKKKKKNITAACVAINKQNFERLK